MSQAVALSVIRQRVRRVADLGPDAATGRYPTADVNREINASHRRLRELASGNGHQLYLKQSAPATMTIGALANTTFGTIPMPADCVSVYGIDVVFSSTDIRSLEPIDWSQRGMYSDVFGGITGPPRGFHVFNAGVESGAAIAAGSIAVVPAANQAYTYTIWYLPAWVERTVDGDVFDCLAGWDDFHVWDAAIPFLAGDNDRQNAYAIAIQERAKAEELVKKRAATIQRVGGGGKRDVRAEQRMNRARGWWRYP